MKILGNDEFRKKSWDKVEMERKGLYCVGWGFVSESDYVLEALSFETCLAPQE